MSVKGEEKWEREGTLGPEIVVEGSGTLSLKKRQFGGAERRQKNVESREETLQGSE